MIFSSPDFIIFFLALLLLYSQLTTVQQRSTLLLVASFIFYASWQPWYLLLLISSLWLNYQLYIRLISAPQKRILVLGIVLNLAVLAFFKYLGMFYGTWLWLQQIAGYEVEAVLPSWTSWILPLGISFFTFQMLSALIDAWRREWLTPISFRQWCLYVTFFPQLIAGPIVRPKQLFTQLEQLPALNLKDIKLGAVIFAAGFIKKVVFSDNLAPFVEQLYSIPLQLDFELAWLATIAFGCQIYLDFSGYSEMAIGLALMLSIHLPRNFLYPYISSNVSEFWTRWHISLSQWLRDYLYIPLGGSKGSLSRTYFNLTLTMLLGGLWHGASWVFVIWGGLHGAYLMAYHFLAHCYRSCHITAESRLGQGLKYAGVVVTFIAISFSWVFFRADSFEAAIAITLAMLGLSEAEPAIWLRSYQYFLVYLTLALIFMEPFIVHFFQRVGIAWWWGKVHFSLRGLTYAGLMLFFIVFSGSTQKFIYFDF